MALRATTVPVKSLLRAQKRGYAYAVKATVEKVQLDPSLPIGSTSFMFSKHGRKMVELQQQITLRTLSHEIVGVHATLPNGGEAGLAKLETAQKILASPALLAQFKKDAALSKKAQANAVAWLNDIRTEKEATEALSKITPRTKALLEKVIQFNEIVPVRQNLGLALDVKQTATVNDFWLAYAAASQLHSQGKTYSTLTGVELSADTEKHLAQAANERVVRAVNANVRALAASKPALLPDAVTYASSLGPAKYNSGAVSTALSAASALINGAAAIPVNAYTVAEVYQLLSQARSQLRDIAETLIVEANERAAIAEGSLLNNSWITLTKAGSKSDVDAAAAFVRANSATANGTVSADWESVIAAQLPSESKALNQALSALASAVQAIPKDLYEAETARRAQLSSVPAFTEAEQSLRKAH